MIRSMTGFGAASAQSEALQAAVTVRSVNHRFLDLSLHVSRLLTPLEAEIKGLVQSRLQRGKVDMLVRATLQEGGAEVVAVSHPLVRGLIKALREIRAEHELAGDVSISDVARFPGALEVLEGSQIIGEGPRAEVMRLVEKALDGLEEMRRSEGRNLARELSRLLQAVEAATERIEARAEAGKSNRRDTLLEKARGLCTDLGLEDGRLYQEVARLVDRYDVSEELQRLRSHVRVAQDLLGGEGDSGKRFDFLCQEMMREANTIGSKATTAPLVQEVVGLKSDIEKLREQAQNIE
jgi:uncharacterized protein (TIGR00255 family)